MANTDLRFDVTALDQASKAFARMGQAVERFEKRLDKLDGKNVDVDLEVNSKNADREVGQFARDLQKRVTAAVKAIPEIEITADSSDAQREAARIRAELAALADQRIGVDIDAAAAQARVAELRGDLERLGDVDLDIAMKADVGAALAQLTAVDAAVDRLDGKTARVEFVADRSLSDAIVKVAALGRALGQIALPAAAVAAAPAIAGIGAAAVSASGALGLIPAAGTAAGLAIGTLVVGFQNMADAFDDSPEKAAEAIAKLAPAARSAVQAIKALGPAWRDLQLDVQGRLFDNLGTHITALSGRYLPILRDTMGRVADSFNYSAQEVGRFLAQSGSVETVRVAFSDLENVVESLSSTFAPLTSVFVDVMAVGAEVLEEVTQGAQGASRAFADFVRNARDTGQLADWMREGVDTVRQLGRILGDIGGIALDVFGAADAAGVSFLGTVERLTQGIRDFTSSVEGQQAIVSLFTGIREVVDTALPGLQRLGEAVGNVITRLQDAGVFRLAAEAFTALAEAAGPMIEDLGALAAAVLPPLLAAVRELAPVLIPVATGLLAISAAAKGLTALTTATAAMSGFVGRVRDVEGAGGKMKTALGGVAGFLGAGGPWGLAIGVGVTALAGLIGAQGDAEQAARDHQAAVEGLKGTLDGYTGAATAATAADRAREISGMKLADGTTSYAEALTRAGVSLEDYTQAASGNEEALARVNAQLVSQATSLVAGNEKYQQYSEGLARAGISLEEFTRFALMGEEGTQQLNTRLGEAGMMFGFTTDTLQGMVGPLGELGSNLQNMSAQVAEAGQQVRDANQANRDFAVTLDAIKVGFAGLAAGAKPTELMAAGFRDLSLAAQDAAAAAADNAEAFGGVEAGAAAARSSMQQSREAFVSAATAAGLSAEQAGALADQIGLIPAAAETTFRTNATGVAAELVTLKAQFDAVPGQKSVTVSALTDEARVRLDEMGFKVETLPNGQVLVTAETAEARTQLDSLVATANTRTATILLGANPAPANGQIQATVAFANGQTGTITVDGNQAPVNGKITAAVAFADGSTGTVTLDANPNPATGKINGTVSYGNGQTATITLDGNPNPANGQITGVVRFGNGQTSTVTIAARDNATPVINRIPKSSTHTVYIRTVGGVSRGVGQKVIPERAEGAYTTPAAYARGGIRTMPANRAEIVPPRQPRLIGDRMVGDEAFIPINRSTRSLTILNVAAERMGFNLMPRMMARGGMIRAEDGSYVNPSFYSRVSPAYAASRRAATRTGSANSLGSLGVRVRRMHDGGILHGNTAVRAAISAAIHNPSGHTTPSVQLALATTDALLTRLWRAVGDTGEAQMIETRMQTRALVQALTERARTPAAAAALQHRTASSSGMFT